MCHPQHTLQLKIVYGTEEDPLLDIALMEEADAFIANCVSAFSAAAKRERPSGQEDRLLGHSVIDDKE